MLQTLRPYQERAKRRTRARMARDRRVLLVLPTGAGKTTIAASIIEDACARGDNAPNRVLFVAHRMELVGQCSRRLDSNGLTQHGIIMGSNPRRRPHAPVQVASIQTLVRRQKTIDPPPALIVIDEAHRTGSVSYQNLLDRYPDAYVLGLTATPWRLDKQGLGRIFGSMIQGVSYAELIAAGHLVPAKVYCPWQPDLKGVPIVGGDYSIDKLRDQYLESHSARQMLEWWQRVANGKRTIAFASGVQHSKFIADLFQGAGIAAEHIDANTPEKVRRDILGRLERGEVQIVSNCGVLCEGWDCPPVEVCILARPTKSLSLFMQMAGRILRPWELDGERKERAIVLDFAAAVLYHGWPTKDRRWSLDDRKGEKKDREDSPVKVCPECYAVIASGYRTCPQCGATCVEEENVDGKGGSALVEVLAADVEKTRKRRIEAWLRDNGFRERWR